MELPKTELAQVSQSAPNWPSSDQRLSCSALSGPARRRIRSFAFFTLILLCCFSLPLYSLICFAIHSELYSHIILIPFISIYLVWCKRYQLALDSMPSRKVAVAFFVVGAAILAVALALHTAGAAQTQDHLTSMTLALLTILWGGYLFVFGTAALRATIFPLSFLIFIAPFSVSIQHHLETFLQVSSATAANLLFQISGTPILQQGTVFQLPGFSFEVAPECSGIHSTLVLFITSFVAGHLLLRNLWAKALLVLFVVPLAIIRNGIRIFVIGELCVHVSPDMIHSYIHRRGGPAFFAGSLIPFFLLLFFLMKIESNRHSPSVKLPA